MTPTSPSQCRTVIPGFRQDAGGEWVAELACGHSQHVRHRPPWQSRPWIAAAAGRAEKVGAAIECPLCVMPEAPADVAEYKRTATFTEATIPIGLLRDHRTKRGVWAWWWRRPASTVRNPLVNALTRILTPPRLALRVRNRRLS